jgi:hypothetical protein
MKTARIHLSALFLAAGLGLPAHAHSWYPNECCSNHDCMPADAIATDENGHKVVIVGSHRIVIPNRLVPRSSPDNRVHICFALLTTEYSAGPAYALPLCLFLPAQS